MKKTITLVLVLIICVSLCMAQNIQEQKRIEAQNVQAEKAAKEQRIQEIKRKHDNAIESAKDNLNKGRYEEAKQDYQTALGLRPENVPFIKQKIAEIDKLILEQMYKEVIASAQRNFDQRQYSQAKQDYLTALELKPENATLLDPKIGELDRLILEEIKKQAESERKRSYEESIASAQRNVEQRQYAQAKQDYLTALNLKPENADFINSKIAEIEKPASLHLYRKGTLLDLLNDNYDVLLEDIIVGRTKNKWKTTETIDDFGEKTVLAVIDGRKAEVRIDFEPGKVYYVRCDVTSREIKTGEWGTRTKRDGMTERYEKTKTEYTPKFELVNVTVGEREFNSIKAK